ncbi:hypothetical protein BCR34DRAFT_604928 [Clohesyomyces aquaticus]|uniref:Uncharacterized protein n=1 Tax=Clohesyomyces aquaticus TaxID=1231657 RepID=A0A1Y1Z355_9PLEO|nr:hypothetical protein BCR34DRAFT_604928 [Clohesyomyces aquaticus]
MEALARMHRKIKAMPANEIPTEFNAIVREHDATNAASDIDLLGSSDFLAHFFPSEENIVSQAYREAFDTAHHHSGPQSMSLKKRQKSLSQSLFLNCNVLNGIIMRHEALIRKRWTRKTIPLRKAILMQPEPPLLVDDTAQYTTLETTSREAPYYLPVQADFGKLQALVSARRNQAEEHVWAPREDPDFFAATTQEYKEHLPELLPDANGNKRVLNADTLISGGVLRSMISDAYLSWFIWDRIQQRIQKVRQLSLNYAIEISPEKDLPLPYFEALVRIRCFLESFFFRSNPNDPNDPNPNQVGYAPNCKHLRNPTAKKLLRVLDLPWNTDFRH